MKYLHFLLSPFLLGCSPSNSAGDPPPVLYDTTFTKIDTTTLFDSIESDTFVVKSGDIDYFCDRFGEVILNEYEKYNILPSVYASFGIMANVGCTTPICDHPSNNYFNILSDGISWDIKYDESHKYAKFGSPWESFRAFSLIMSNDFEYAIDSEMDYHDWLILAYNSDYIRYQDVAVAEFLIIDNGFDKFDK